MLIIRLTRLGRRNIPSFRVVLTEKQNPVKGKFIEMLGYYNPRLKTRSFKKERILYWLGQGVKCSATVHNLLVDEKIIKGPKVKAWHPKKQKTKEPPVSVEAGKKDKAQAPKEELAKEEPKKEAVKVKKGTPKGESIKEASKQEKEEKAELKEKKQVEPSKEEAGTEKQKKPAEKKPAKPEQKIKKEEPHL